MEFLCQRSDLVRGVATVERAVSTRESMPILEGILVRARGDRLQLVATDLEMSVECYVPARVQTEGSTVLGGKVIGQIVRKLGGEEVTYKTEENGVARIESGRSRFSVHTMAEDDFPSLPEVDQETMWRMSQGSFRRMIRHTAFAAATDDSRPFLTGIYIEVEGEEIRLVATDSSRLAFRKGRLIEAAKEPATGIVPVRSLSELMRILDSAEETEVEFTVAENQAVFRLAGVQMISRVIEGQFPDYKRVFPGEQSAKFRLDREEFLAAVERVSLIARRNTPVVKLQVADNTLSLSAREAEVGQAFEEVSVKQEGSDGEAAYQARYLMDVLKAMECDDVQVALGEGLKQGSLSPVDSDDYLYIVMPVRVG